MGKRFNDTDKFLDAWYRNLPAPYKVLWEYVCCSCDSIGVWIVEDEIARFRIGKDIKVDFDKALELYNKDKQRVYVFSGGNKWYLIGFIAFQYGILSDRSRVHKGLLNRLKEEGLLEIYQLSLKGLETLTKPFPNPLVTLSKPLDNPLITLTEPFDNNNSNNNINTTGSNNNIINNIKDANASTSPDSDAAVAAGKKESKINFGSLLDYWNKTMEGKAIPTLRNLTSQRKAMLNARMSEYGKEAIVEVIKRAAQSSFLNGGGDRGSVFGFDWIFRPNNFVKVLEGYYDNKHSSSKPTTVVPVKMEIKSAEDIRSTKEKDFEEEKQRILGLVEAAKDNPQSSAAKQLQNLKESGKLKIYGIEV